MQLPVILICCLAIVYGCRAVEHSTSESKQLWPEPFPVRRIGLINYKILASIGSLAKGTHNDGLVNITKWILEPEVAYEVVNAYRRGYDKLLMDWNKDMTALKKKKDAILEQPAPSTRIGVLDELNDEAENITQELVNNLGNRLNQIKVITKDVSDKEDAARVLLESRFQYYFTGVQPRPWTPTTSLSDFDRLFWAFIGEDVLPVSIPSDWYATRQFLRDLITDEVVGDKFKILMEQWVNVLEEELKFAGLSPSNGYRYRPRSTTSPNHLP